MFERDIFEKKDGLQLLKENIDSDINYEKKNDYIGDESELTDNPLMKELGFIKEKKKTINGKYKKKSLDEWLPIKDIKYGIICTNDNRYIKILEIAPINFFSKPVNEQNLILDQFAAWLKVAPVSYTFKCMSVKGNPNAIIKNILKSTRNETNPGLLECRDDCIDNIKKYVANNLISKRYFFIYEYRGGNNSTDININDVYSEMYKVAVRFTSDFTKMGNIVLTDFDDTYASAEILYSILNRNTSYDESFDERIIRITQDTAAVQNIENCNDVNVPITKYISQRGFYPNYKNYLISDGLYYSFLYIPSNGYNTHSLYGGWTNIFTTLGEGIDTDIYFEKKISRTIKDDLKRRIRWNKVSINEKNSTGADVDEMMDDFYSKKYILNKLNNSDDFYEMSVLLTITSKTPEELENKIHNVIEQLTEYEIYTECPNYKMKEAFIMALPLMIKDRFIWNNSKQNITSSDIAGTYMMTSYEMFDTTGNMFGINSSGSMIAMNPFNTRYFKNANMLLIGTPGSGKTFTEQVIIRRLRLIGIPVMGILPTKAVEYRRGLNHMGGLFIQLYPMSHDCINIMEIRPVDRINENLIEGDFEYRKESALSAKINQIIIFIQLLMKNEQMTNEEIIYINESLTLLYAKFGITQNNESIYMDSSRTTLKPMPIIGDWYNMIKDTPQLQRISVILRLFINGTCKNMNGQTNVNLNNDLIMFDVEGAGKDFLPAFMFIALTYIYDKVKADRTKNAIISLDEVWRMMINPIVAEYILELVKVIRGYGGGTLIATQDLNDFLSYNDGIYGKGIIASSKIKMIFQLEDGEVDKVTEFFKLSESDRKDILTFERGSGMLIANSDKMKIHINPSEIEMEDFSTDPNDLRRIAEKRATQ